VLFGGRSNSAPRLVSRPFSISDLHVGWTLSRRLGATTDSPNDHAASTCRGRDWVDAHELPTSRSTLQARYVRVLLTCWSCRHQRDADLEALIARDRGDAPLVRLRWRCGRCSSQRVDMVCTSKDVVRPW
jgi:hypothetical protein